MTRGSLLLVGLLLPATGCFEADSLPGDSLRPLAPGETWTYSVLVDGEERTKVMRFVGPEPGREDELRFHVIERDLTGARREERIDVVRADLALVSSQQLTSPLRTWYEPAFLPLLPPEPRHAASLVRLNTGLYMESDRIDGSLEIVGAQFVEVPAGRFRALELIVGSSRGGESDAGRVWLVAEVGPPVKVTYGGRSEVLVSHEKK